MMKSNSPSPSQCEKRMPLNRKLLKFAATEKSLGQALISMIITHNLSLSSAGLKGEKGDRGSPGIPGYSGKYRLV